MTGNDAKGLGAKTLELLDKAIALQAPLARRHVERLKGGKTLTPTQILKRLNNELRAATTTSGAAVGAASSAPGVGTGIGVALTAAEALTFLQACTLYVLSRAEVHGIPLEDVVRRRVLVLAIMLGESGNKAISEVAGRTGQHWAKKLVSAIPMKSINSLNKVLGARFITKYGTRQGIVVLGRAMPFGIGAAIGGGLNLGFAQMVIVAANRAFGDPPAAWVVSSPKGPESDFHQQDEPPSAS